MDAMLPVEKNALCKSVKKNSDILASVSVKLLYVGVLNAAGKAAEPFCWRSSCFFCADRDLGLPFGEGEGVAHGLATGAGLVVM